MQYLDCAIFDLNLQERAGTHLKQRLPTSSLWQILEGLWILNRIVQWKNSLGMKRTFFIKIFLQYDNVNCTQQRHIRFMIGMESWDKFVFINHVVSAWVKNQGVLAYKTDGVYSSDFQK